MEKKRCTKGERRAIKDTSGSTLANQRIATAVFFFCYDHKNAQQPTSEKPKEKKKKKKKESTRRDFYSMFTRLGRRRRRQRQQACFVLISGQHQMAGPCLAKMGYGYGSVRNLPNLIPKKNNNNHHNSDQCPLLMSGLRNKRASTLLVIIDAHYTCLNGLSCTITTRMVQCRCLALSMKIAVVLVPAPAFPL